MLKSILMQHYCLSTGHENCPRSISPGTEKQVKIQQYETYERCPPYRPISTFRRWSLVNFRQLRVTVLRPRSRVANFKHPIYLCIYITSVYKLIRGNKNAEATSRECQRFEKKSKIDESSFSSFFFFFIENIFPRFLINYYFYIERLSSN